ncbi:unnamed protein product, partial [Medioppia subpectinata]
MMLLGATDFTSRKLPAMTTRQWSNAIYSPTTQTPGDLTLVDVPLEPITISPDDSEHHL